MDTGAPSDSQSNRQRDWQCVAYPDDQPPNCFHDLGDGHACTNREQCETRTSTVRQRVYRGIHERAAHGDPTMARLAEDYTRPDDILPTPDRE